MIPKKIISMILTLGFLSSIAAGVPGIPHQFYGSVDLTNGPAPNGLLIEAKIGGVTVADTITLNGKYGYEPELFFVTDPDNNRNGEEISFFVNGIDTGETIVFENGAHTEIDFYMNFVMGEIEADENVAVEDVDVYVTNTTPAVVNVGDDLSITINTEASANVTINNISKQDVDELVDVYKIGVGVKVLNAYEISITNDNVDITVTMSYDPAGIDEDSIKPYKYVNGEWVKIDEFTLDKNNNRVIFKISANTPYMLGGIKVCSDGTRYGECSSDKPKYCDNGNLIDNCQKCGCPSGKVCRADGSCYTTAPAGGGGPGGGGGPYGAEPKPSCFDGIQNQGEEGIDCGGPCKPCPSCFDGIQNQGEEGIDCGGPCKPCPTTTTTKITTTTSTTTTSTTVPVTTTTTAPVVTTTTTIAAPSIIGRVIRFSAENATILLSVLIVLILFGYAVYSRGKKG